MRLPGGKRTVIRFPLAGGMNTADDQRTLKPGVARLLKGYEHVQGHGYRRAEGWERRAPTASVVNRNCPSQAVAVKATSTTAGTIGGAVVGATSGAQAYIRALASDVGGVKTYWLEKISGANFTVGEGLNGSGLVAATSSVVGQYAAETAPRLSDGWKDGMRAIQRAVRANLAAVPGSGPIRGVFIYAGDYGEPALYAIRNNSGGTAAVLHRQDPSSGAWFTVDTGEEIDFTAGNAYVGAGDTLTQGGATATIVKVVITSGDASLGTAAGRLIIAGRSGGNFGAGVASSTGGGALTLSAIQTAVTLAPNGTYEFVVHNFSGADGQEAVFGVSGVHRAFEMGSASYGGWKVPILLTTGMAVDTPTHVAVHMARLFLSFPGGSVQWSSAGDPFIWNVITGAGEIGLGDDVTALRSIKTDQLIVAGKNRIFGLYGSSFDVASFVPLLQGTGCYAGCMADVGGLPLATDAVGAYLVQQGQISGDYRPEPLSREIDAEIKAALTANRTGGKRMFAIFSGERWQYRLFSPAEGLEYRLRLRGLKPVGWSVHPSTSSDTGGGSYTASGTIVCAFVGEDAYGNEMIVAGTDAGFVVILDSGNSADGAAIEARCDLVAATLGYDGLKRAHGALIELEFTPDANGDIGIQPGFSVAGDYGLGESQELNAVGAEPVDSYVQAPVSQPAADTRVAEIYYPCSVTATALSLQLTVTDDIDPPFTIRNAGYDVQPLGKRK